MSAPTSAQKRELAAHAAKVYRAGGGLLATHVALSPVDVAAALGPVCLTGADRLVIGGVTYELLFTPQYSPGPLDLRFGPAAATSLVQSCAVEAVDGNVRITLVGPGGWRTVNGSYPPDDPENLSDEAQRRNGLNRSGQIYRIAFALYADDVTIRMEDVADALRPLCLRAFSSVTMNGRVYPYSAPAVPIGVTGCTVEVGEFDVFVTVTTANGGRYVNGAAQ